MKHLNLVSLMILLGLVAGCNTVKGAGQDIEAAGEKVQDVAEDAKDRLDD